MTIAKAVDLIITGKLSEACDVLPPRFKSVETAATDGNWGFSSHLELPPEMWVSSLGAGERSVALALGKRWSEAAATAVAACRVLGNRAGRTAALFPEPSTTAVALTAAEPHQQYQQITDVGNDQSQWLASLGRRNLSRRGAGPAARRQNSWIAAGTEDEVDMKGQRAQQKVS
eukprot:6491642-Amphidinium_carterae.3